MAIKCGIKRATTYSFAKATKNVRWPSIELIWFVFKVASSFFKYLGFSSLFAKSLNSWKHWLHLIHSLLTRIQTNICDNWQTCLLWRKLLPFTKNKFSPPLAILLMTKITKARVGIMPGQASRFGFCVLNNA